MRSTDIPDLTAVVLAAAYDGSVQLSSERRENDRVIGLIEEAIAAGLVVRPTDPGTAPLKLDARDPQTVNQVVRLRVTLASEADGFWAHVRDVAKANKGAFTIATADLRRALDGKGVHLRDPGFVAMLGVADAAKLGWKVERTVAGDGFEFTPNAVTHHG